MTGYPLQEGRGFIWGGGGRDLDFRGLAFLHPDGADLLLEKPLFIVEAIRNLLHLLDGRTPPFEETLDWLQFYYTTDRTGSYVAPVSTFLTWSAVSEG